MKANVIANFELENADIKAIKKYCIDEDITLDKLAKRVGVSRTYLNLIMSGKQRVSFKLYQKFAKLGIFKKEEAVLLVLKELKG